MWGWATVWSKALAKEGPETCQQTSEGLPGLGTTRTSSLGIFWTGHHKALRFPTPFPTLP